MYSFITPNFFGRHIPKIFAAIYWVQLISYYLAKFDLVAFANLCARPGNVVECRICEGRVNMTALF